MKNLAFIVSFMTLVGCSGIKKNDEGQVFQSSDVNIKQAENIKKYYEDPDYTETKFDTLIGNVNLKMRTYCLNDSAVYNETYTEDSKKNNKEYFISHNYATDIVLKLANGNLVNSRILKENFKDSLPSGFFKICRMWKNEFSHYEKGLLTCKATLTQPDTDYQMAIVYSVSEKGNIKIMHVEDESCNGEE